MLTQERLKELLHYNPDTGVFTRNTSGRRWKAGETSGCLLNTGYIAIRMDKKNYQAHRLAWLYIHGRLPDNEIDHINGVRSSNGILNLREASRSENSQNRRGPISKNVSGYLGVRFAAERNKYVATIGIDGKYTFLGRFDTAIEASCAYLAAKREMHPFGEIAKCPK